MRSKCKYPNQISIRFPLGNQYPDIAKEWTMWWNPSSSFIHISSHQQEIFIEKLNYVYESMKTKRNILLKHRLMFPQNCLTLHIVLYLFHKMYNQKSVKHYNSSRPGKIPSFCQRKPTIFCLLLGWAKRSIEHLWFFTPGSKPGNDTTLFYV